MPNIGNIPQSMITEHVSWHMRPGRPAEGGRVINPWPPGTTDAVPGSGEEFLVWHKGYIERFRDWVDGLPEAQRPDANAIAPWTEIPAGLKMGMVGWNSQRAAQEARLRDMPSFATLDDLGRFLEWGLHGWLHGASSSMWNEPVLGSFESPRSTFFWQLHGLIDHWRQQWVDAHATSPIPPPVLDDLRRLRELLHVVQRPPRWPFPTPLPPIPPRPLPGPGPDPAPFDLSAEELRMVSLMRLLRGSDLTLRG